MNKKEVQEANKKPNSLEIYLNKNLKELENKLVLLEQQMDARISELRMSDPLYRDFNAQYVVLGKEALKCRHVLEGKEIPKELSQIPIPLKLPKTSTKIKSE